MMRQENLLLQDISVHQKKTSALQDIGHALWEDFQNYLDAKRSIDTGNIF